AVGAGDMDHRRQLFLRVTERGEQPFDAAQRQVDLLRVQLRQPRQHPVAGQWSGHGAILPSYGGAGSATLTSARCGSRNNERMRARVACSSARGTTWST